jgi:hypothetical protein
VAEDNSEGRPLRAGAQPANAEEMLAELVRLVESSALAPKRSTLSAETVPKPKRTDTAPMQPLEMTAQRSSLDAPAIKPGGTRPVDVQPPRADEDPERLNLATGQRSGGWTFMASAIVLACAAVIGSIFWFKRVESRLPEAPPLIATAQAPTALQPPSNSTVAASSDAGATPFRAIAQPAQGKVVSPEEPPIDPNARGSLSNPPPSTDLGLAAIAAAQPTADASAGKPLAEPVDTPAVAALIAPSQPTASQSLDPKPVPVPTVPLPPDSPEAALPTPSATNSGVAANASDAPLPPVRPAPKAAVDSAGVVQRSTQKVELPTKLSGKSVAHVVVARAEAIGPGVRAATPTEPLRLGASVKPEKGAKTVTTAQAPAAAQAPPSAQPAPAKQPNPNPVVHAFNSVVGALNGLNPFAAH